jgi:hypothetical protein
MRLLSNYVPYYQEDNTHLGLGKEIPFGGSHSDGPGLVLSRERLGGGRMIVAIELLKPLQCSIVQRARFLYPLYVCVARAGVPARENLRAQ